MRHNLGHMINKVYSLQAVPPTPGFESYKLNKLPPDPAGQRAGEYTNFH